MFLLLLFPQDNHLESVKMVFNSSITNNNNNTNTNITTTRTGYIKVVNKNTLVSNCNLLTKKKAN